MLKDLVKECKGLHQENRACRYCGQIRMIEVPNNWTEEQREEMTIECCICPDAMTHNGLKHRKEKAHERIEMLFGEQSELPIDENVEKLLYMAVDAAVDLDIENVTISIKDGTKASIRRTTKGSIKIERSEISKNTYEL